MTERVVLAYSGGLDTSAIVPWLREHYDAQVVCVAVDVGQGAGELVGIEEKAKRSGAEAIFINRVNSYPESIASHCYKPVAVNDTITFCIS